MAFEKHLSCTNVQPLLAKDVGSAVSFARFENAKDGKDSEHLFSRCSFLPTSAYSFSSQTDFVPIRSRRSAS